MNKNLKSLLEQLLIFLLVFLTVRYVFSTSVGIAIVSGNSMLPNYHDGQIVLFIRTTNVTSGDVVIIDHGSKCTIKRVIGKSGDIISIDNNNVYVNHNEICKDYLYEDTATIEQTVTMPHTVKQGSIFVLGDNRVSSLDSRYLEFGDIDIKMVEGKVVYKLAK